MAISHIYNQTVADGTATSVVRPSDWNSVHNQFMTLGGNTVGQSTLSGSNIIFQGGNNITLSQVQGVGVGTIVISGNNQTVDTNKAGVGFTSTSTVGVAIVGTNNTNGLSLGIPNYLTTAQPVGAYLTTAANSTHSHNFATTTTGGSNIVVGAANSVGATIGVPPFITTYVAQTTQTQPAGNIAGVGTTFAGTNITATLGLNSNGLALSLSAGAGGGGTINQTGPNIAVAGSTVTSGDVYFSNSPTVTFGMAGSTITASAAGGGGGGVTVGGHELFPLGNNTAFSTLGLNTIYFQKFICPENISFNNLEMRVSGSTVSSAVACNANHTYDYAMYSRNTGASSTQYNLIASSRLIMQASYSSNLSAGFTVSQDAGSYTFTSAGTVGQGTLSGFKHLYLPFTSTITAGGEYAVAMRMSSATTGNTGALRLGIKVMTNYVTLTVGKIYASTIVASNASYVGDYAMGVYSATSSNLPSTLGISGLTNAVSQQRLYVQFEV